LSRWLVLVARYVSKTGLGTTKYTVFTRFITGPPNMGQCYFACWRLSPSVVCNAVGWRVGRALGRSGGRHCTAGQYGYVPLGRHPVTIGVIKDCYGWHVVDDLTNAVIMRPDYQTETKMLHGLETMTVCMVSKL